VCGQSRWALKLRRVQDYISEEYFDILRCATCGLAITDPMPGDDIIERYYSARYRGDRHAFTDRLRVSLRARKLQSRFAPGFAGRLLDIGCGDGHFAMRLRDSGWRVSVTEINSIFLDRLRADGIEASTPEEALRDGFGHRFDAVTCWHVLEHVMRPAELVKWVGEVLEPGGLFQVTVPMLSSWQARLSARHWLHLDVPRHRYHFDQHTLRRILCENGLQVLDSSTFALEYDWFGAVQSALNAVCTRRNVLFERMTSQARQWPGSRGDILVSCLLAGPVAAATLPFCLTAWVFGRGATLTITASKPK
jgi:2-polyprenyl-3-methyl-5-hydroxy-6-metoxy-1,4-benzoquinol methylase